MEKIILHKVKKDPEKVLISKHCKTRFIINFTELLIFVRYNRDIVMNMEA